MTGENQHVHALEDEAQLTKNMNNATAQLNLSSVNEELSMEEDEDDHEDDIDQDEFDDDVPDDDVPDDDLDEAVSRARGQRVQARHGRAFGHDAQQVARLEAGPALPRQPLPPRQGRQRKAQDGHGHAQVGAMVASLQQGHSGGVGHGGLVVQRQRCAQHLAQLLAPAREVLGGLAVNGAQWH